MLQLYDFDLLFILLFGWADLLRINVFFIELALYYSLPIFDLLYDVWFNSLFI